MGLWLAAAAVVLIATAWDGASTHGSALLLRICVAAMCWAAWTRKPIRMPRRALVVPAISAALVLVAFARAPNHGAALQPLVTVVLVLLAFVALVATERDWLAPLWLIALAVAVVHSGWAVIQRWGVGAARGTGGFFNPNLLAAFIAPVAVMLAGRLLEPRPLPSAQRLAGWAALVLLSCGLIATGSRSGLLAAGLAAIILVVWRWRHQPLLVAAGLVVVLAAVGSIAGRWLGRHDMYAYSRLPLWWRSLLLGLHHPLGVGLDGYGAAMRRFGVPLSGWVRYPKVAHSAHSELLQAWVELGWPGLVAVGLPVLWVAESLRHPIAAGATPTADGAPPLWASLLPQRPVVLIAALVTLAVPALLFTSLHAPPIAFLAALWAATAIRGTRVREPTVALPGGTRARAVVALLAVAAVLAVVPDAASYAAMQRATHERDTAHLGRALADAQWAARLAPWRVAPVLLVQSLHALRHDASALDISERLADLAGRFPADPRPPERAAWLVEQSAARAAGDATPLWTLAAKLRRLQLQRDPHNALAAYAVAVARDHAGNRSAAAAALHQALAIEPHCARALALAARFALAAGNVGRARHDAAAAVAANAHAKSYHGYGAQVLSLPASQHTMLQDAGLFSP